MPVRLKDIAEDLGVSIITVSKVLRGHSDISEETRQRVLKRMKEMNYQPNLAARALVTGRTLTIGLVVPDLTHPFFALIARGIHFTLRRKGYGLLITTSLDNPEIEKQEINNLISRRVDVLIVASAQQTAESFHSLEEQKIPYILIDRNFPGLNANFVGVDDVAIGMMATQHLLELGCRRIAHLRGPEVSTSRGRLEGYKKALTAWKLVPSEDYIVGGQFGDTDAIEGGFQMMQQLLKRKPKPDGLFCFNDPIALGALRALSVEGLRVPLDIAVIGCGNFLYSEFLRIPLSSVDQNSEFIGERTAKLALSLVGGKAPLHPKSLLVPPQLIVRASTSFPKGKKGL
jgi:LacI family transcriptional regulator